MAVRKEVPTGEALMSFPAAVEAVAALGRRHETIEDALPGALEIVGAIPGVLVVRVVHLASPSAPGAVALERWHSAIPQKRVGAVRRAASKAEPLAPGRAGRAGVSVAALGGGHLNDVERAARSVGCKSVIHVDVRAESRPVAVFEVFSESSAEPDSPLTGLLGLLGGVLGQLASRERLRHAVRRAADHARVHDARIRELQSTVEKQRGRIRELEKASEEGAAARAVEEYRGLGTALSVAPFDGDPTGAPAFELAASEPAASRPDGPSPRDLLFDPTTGLPGPALLEDRIAQAIRRRRRSPRNQFAVIAVEMDGLERVETQAGAAGTRDVLASLARRIGAQLRDADTVAVYGPGCFGVVLEEIRAPEEARTVAQRIRSELSRPAWAGTVEARPEIRMGIVLGGPAYDRPEITLGDARTAAARARARNEAVVVFDQISPHEDERQRRLETDLARAIQADELFLEYQPIVSLLDGRITGIEVYLRWRHPELGLVPPTEFIPLATSSPVIYDLGAWVFERAGQQIRRWQELLDREIPTIGINVTARQLFHDRTPDRLRQVLRRIGLQPGQFRFDIPEDELMQDPRRAQKGLAALRDMGFQFAIDDFGTGFSSLSLLHALPLGALKIDRTFVSRGIDTGTTGWSVARTVLEIGRVLELHVIAEGVETRDQFRFLRSIGCQEAQGFYFSGPVSAARMVEMIREGYPLETNARR